VGVATEGRREQIHQVDVEVPEMLGGVGNVLGRRPPAVTSPSSADTAGSPYTMPPHERKGRATRTAGNELPCYPYAWMGQAWMALKIGQQKAPRSGGWNTPEDKSTWMRMRTSDIRSEDDEVLARWQSGQDV
jgi:hypothetical protein